MLFRSPLMRAQGFKIKNIAEETEGDYSVIVIEEGGLEYKTTKQRKRSQKLVTFAIKEFKKNYKGKLFCLVCNFDFYKAYSNYGKDYIEIHHIEPVHKNDMRGSKMTLIKALKKVVPVCSNCHRMIHRKKGQLLPVEKLKAIVTNSNTKK